MTDIATSDEAYAEDQISEIGYEATEFFYPDEIEQMIREWWKQQNEHDIEEFVHETNGVVHLSLRIAEVLTTVVECTRHTKEQSADNAVTHIAASQALRRVMPKIIRNLQMLSAAMSAQRKNRTNQQPGAVDEWPGMYL